MTLNICFVSHNAYGALVGGNGGHIGGIERQISIMAIWLVERGHRVSVLTWDEGQEDGLDIEGVTNIKMCRKDAGLPGLRFFYPKWSSLSSAMARANADIYYHNGAECVTGQVAIWCQRNQRKFVFSTAADADCMAHLPMLGRWRDRRLYTHGLNRADAIITQTQRQKELLNKSFGLPSQVLAMPCPGPLALDRTALSKTRAVWVGRICEAKRPDRLLVLAEDLPDMEIDVVGPPDDSEYSRKFQREARALPNLVLHGGMRRDEMPRFYESAGFLICTSDREGFPNTFLEAWSYGLPIISTFDPDDLLSSRNLGIAVKSAPELVQAIRLLLESAGLWERLSRNAYDYYLKNHTMDNVMRQYEKIFVEALV